MNGGLQLPPRPPELLPDSSSSDRSRASLVQPSFTPQAALIHVGRYSLRIRPTCALGLWVLMVRWTTVHDAPPPKRHFMSGRTSGICQNVLGLSPLHIPVTGSPSFHMPDAASGLDRDVVTDPGADRDDDVVAGGRARCDRYRRRFALPLRELHPRYSSSMLPT